MGSGPSQEEYERFALHWYELALNSTCVLPDVGIDESLVKFSGVTSNTELQTYSSELVQSVPGFVEKLGSSFGALTVVPNAVGIGALVISMIMEIVMKGSKEETPDSYSLLRRVFGEEKASSVRDTMKEYMKRHRMFVTSDEELLEEIQILERQLSKELTNLGNSLLHDGQMSTRGFKVWVNGASFHVQMLIHQARLDIQAGKPASDFDYKIKAAIDEYLKDLDTLLVKYKTYMSSVLSLDVQLVCNMCPPGCYLTNTEANCEVPEGQRIKVPCDLMTSYTKDAHIDHIFSNYKPIITLKDHFSSIKTNVDSLIIQNDAFTLPSE